MSLLGAPQILLDGKVRVLDARPAALLAYLAAEGPRPRSACAALLWPDTPPAAARNNLAQLLRRLEQQAGRVLVSGQRGLALTPHLTVDLWDPPLPGEAALLGGVDADFSRAFEDWLDAQRERRRVAQDQQVVQAIAALVEDGNLIAATALAAQRVERDPLNEEAHQLLMQLYHRRGDRAAAMQAYLRLQATFRLELGEEPSAETARLARDLAAGEAAHPPRQPMPLSLLRPPVLLGREEAWAQMEAGWTAGAGVALIGAPGSGKSRLVLDFVQAHPNHHVLLLQGQAGDQDTAYSAHARTYRQTLDAFPGLAASLPDWVRRELARIIPELGPAPAPLASDEEKLRFYDAKYEVLRRVTERGPVVLISDDLQFMDDASIEAGAYVYAKFWGNGHAPLRSMFCYREGTLSAAAEALSRQMYASGLVRPVHLAPLGTDATEALLRSIEVPGAARLAVEVQRFTGGNPQLTLEFAKYLYAQGEFGVEAVKEAANRTLGGLVAERLARLSPAAFQAAQAAVTLRSDFSLEQVAEVLGWGIMELLGAWEELEHAQVVRGERFAHDLVAQAVQGRLEEMPMVCALLHRKAARVLGEQGAPPARVAAHWQAGNQTAQAAPWWERAAQHAEATRHFAEAAGFYLSASQAFAEAGDAGRAEEMRRRGEHAARLSAPVTA
ncbi:DNA-binding transcriptional activator of the SARP family [Deinococcus hopiensis KR-140]|uniref:DNA-binding transcriptional activator of the SARP family n=1 Tax=Deinococcus hopiensis KR-140 TaxID=695939 RepID=A0A1W1UNC0_9DEIO|nr:DNA-binding transcriptional activator of the SARP family [Deinococcus hopiensis KR-140]